MCVATVDWIVEGPYLNPRLPAESKKPGTATRLDPGLDNGVRTARFGAGER